MKWLWGNDFELRFNMCFSNTYYFVLQCKSARQFLCQIAHVSCSLFTHNCQCYKVQYILVQQHLMQWVLMLDTIILLSCQKSTWKTSEGCGEMLLLPLFLNKHPSSTWYTLIQGIHTIFDQEIHLSAKLQNKSSNLRKKVRFPEESSVTHLF